MKVNRVAMGRERVRLAGPDDNEVLCDLFKNVPMKGDMAIAIERDPNFFALYEMQDLDAHVYVMEDTQSKTIEGISTCLTRAGYIDGRQTVVGYLGDLRTTRRVRGGAFMVKYFASEMKKLWAATGCEVALTAIFRENRAAKFALVRRRKKDPDAPVYTKVRSYSITNVHVLRQRRRRLADCSVTTATPKEIPEIASFLDAHQRKCQFGYPMPEATLRHRLQNWPGLDIESFFLARDTQGNLVGVTACWDPDPVKRIRVYGYNRRFRWIKRGVNGTRFITKAASLPEPGGSLRTVYLTHVAITGEDPATMAELFRHCYNAQVAKGVHMLCAYVEEGGVHEQSFSAYRSTIVPADLYAVSLPGSEFNNAERFQGPVAFEMSLV